MVTKTSYSSNEVDIPAAFLTTTPNDAQPITITPIDWSKTVLPENGERYAVVLDNVISASECAELLRLAELSVPTDGRGPQDSAWRPALVNVGRGYEKLISDYRNSDRIIWDHQEVVDRLWDRCLQAPGLREKLAVLENDQVILGPARRADMKRRWEFRRLNQRMRFLKYTGGQFFRPHCDGAYREERTDDKVIQTHFTIHLYLNDSRAEVGDASDLEGGATSFLSDDETKKVDVNPKAGRVLVFQHRSLLHSGDDVTHGTKYTMRTDIMYEYIREPAAPEA